MFFLVLGYRVWPVAVSCECVFVLAPYPSCSGSFAGKFAEIDSETPYYWYSECLSDLPTGYSNLYYCIHGR